MVRELEFKSEDPGFDPLAGQCVQLSTARTQMCAHSKDPVSICRKRTGLTAGDMETRKHCTQGEKKKLRSAVLRVPTGPGILEKSWNFVTESLWEPCSDGTVAALFPRGKQPGSPCIAWGKESYRIFSQCFDFLRLKAWNEWKKVKEQTDARTPGGLFSGNILFRDISDFREKKILSKK